jgi:hypothetical protein
LLSFSRPDPRHADFAGNLQDRARVHSRYCTLFSGAIDGDGWASGDEKARWRGPENRAKRLIREIFRHNDIAPGFDVVVVPKRQFFEASLTILEADYRAALERRLRTSR